MPNTDHVDWQNPGYVTLLATSGAATVASLSDGRGGNAHAAGRG